MTRPPHDARHRDRLAIDKPESVVAVGGDLRKPFRARHRIVRDRLAHEGHCPVGKQLDVGWGDQPRVPRCTRIVWLLPQHVNLLRYGLEERQAELDGLHGVSDHEIVLVDPVGPVAIDRLGMTEKIGNDRDGLPVLLGRLWRLW